MSASFVSTHDLLKDQHPPFVSLPEAAKIIGNNPSTWYRWLSDNTMPVPSVVIGSCRRIRLLDLCHYIDTQIQNPQVQPKKRRGRPPRFNAAVVGINTHTS